MRAPALILAVDDVQENLEIVRVRLEWQGYTVAPAQDGEEALAKVRELEPDLILLDVMMPKLDGLSVLKRLKEDRGAGFVPVIMLTAKASSADIVAGLDAGADDYLTKPFDQAALVARVRAMLRIKSLHETVRDLAERLRQQTEELAALNRSLEARVAAQVAELESPGRLRRFLAPQVAQLVASTSGRDALLETHRREITVVFCDLRGFTSFSESAEPEEVIAVLRDYHRVLGNLIYRYEGTLERFAGDGLLILFNDPIPCPDHTERAVRMAADMREEVARLVELWRKQGHDLGFGVGIALGYATLGGIGFDQRLDYGAVGSVVNLASRLCDEAQAGQILVTQRVLSKIEGLVEAVSLEPMVLKGFSRPVPAYNVVRMPRAPEIAGPGR